MQGPPRDRSLILQVFRSVFTTSGLMRLLMNLAELALFLGVSCYRCSLGVSHDDDGGAPEV